MRKTLLAVVMLGILTSACGGNDDVGSTAATATLSPTTTTPSSAPSTTGGSGATTTTTSSASTSSTSTSSTSGGGAGGPALSAASTLDLRGVGPVRIGMTLAEASAAAGLPIGPPPSPTECSYAKAEGGPGEVHFMFANGRIARVDVRDGSPVKTRSGAGIGDTEAQVQARYSNRLTVEPHKYLAGGHYLTLVPNDPADADLRLIFETDGSKVLEFRSGQRPEVEQVERCG